MKKISCFFFIFTILFIGGCNKSPIKESNSYYTKYETIRASSVDNGLDSQDHNTIDDYFNTMAIKIQPTTTYEMLMFETLISEAWRAELLNCYEVIKSKTSEEMIHKLLDSERNSYLEYTDNKAEIDIYYSSGVFDGQGVMLGTLSNVDRVCILADGYKLKTIELMERLKEIGDEPAFIFDRDKFYTKLKEQFFEAHPNAFE